MANKIQWKDIESILLSRNPQKRSVRREEVDILSWNFTGHGRELFHYKVMEKGIPYLLFSAGDDGTVVMVFRKVDPSESDARTAAESLGGRDSQVLL